MGVVRQGRRKRWQSESVSRFVTGGIGGKGLFSRRPDDAFGIGYFHYNLSDALQSAIDPFFTFNDEQGLEAFYDVAVTPWLRVAGDVQYVNPALGDTDDAFLGGLRLKVRF